MAKDYFLGGSVKKFPLQKEGKKKYVPGTCLTLKGPFNDVIAALKEYFERWSNLNTHVGYLQGLRKLNQVAKEFNTLPTDKDCKDSASEKSSGAELHSEPIPHKDPLPYVVLTKDFTEKFIRACKTQRNLPPDPSEEEIKTYLVERTHK